MLLNNPTEKYLVILILISTLYENSEKPNFLVGPNRRKCPKVTKIWADKLFMVTLFSPIRYRKFVKHINFLQNFSNNTKKIKIGKHIIHIVKKKTGCDSLISVPLLETQEIIVDHQEKIFRTSMPWDWKLISLHLLFC